ncbi:MAG: hypothetical protein N4A48_02990 [Tepidibacter sp.]|jgi:hypothetical protein|uniref:hypothetical protein n=1 Tax=Tepidibacter sp. TaxID=2529387 RepID=UPI0025EE03ED|nr:hypothetical protein [Tepidibacter sp.]MCT4507723.1 hypothetical protein [Tepidibacter sp.]
MLKIKKIQNKEEIEVLAQLKDCSTKGNAFGNDKGCDEDCIPDEYHYAYYGSPKY